MSAWVFDKWAYLGRANEILCDATTGSSEALLSGQKPPFRLLVRAKQTIDQSTATHFRTGVSEPFVVRC